MRPNWRNQRLNFFREDFYTISLAAGITITDTTDSTIVANLSHDKIAHLNLVFHGNTIRVQSTVTDRHETINGDRELVTAYVEVFNENVKMNCSFVSSTGRTFPEKK